MQLPPSQRIELREFIAEHFSREELLQLCFDYFRDFHRDHDGVNITNTALINKLIGHCERHDSIDNLRVALQKARPAPYEAKFGRIRVAEVTVQPRNPKQVFVSHAHEDAEFAQRLAADLRKAGVPVWIAPDSIQPGEAWMRAIDRGLKESGVFIAALTPNAVKSEWVRDETEIAIGFQRRGEIRLLPLLVEPCDVAHLSVWLNRYQYIPFAGRYVSALNQVLHELGVAATKISEVSKTSEVAAPKSQPKEATLVPQVEVAPRLSRGPAESLLIETPIRLELVHIPAGEFLMGSDKVKDNDARDNELPQHGVYLNEYHIGKFPITNIQYAAYVKATSSKFSVPTDKERHPVVNVSWDDAMAFCKWLSQATGRVFSLPTEAQWEKAARWDAHKQQARIWPWGNTFHKSKAHTNEGGAGNTTPVGSYSSRGGDSPYGCADMAGNVLEWCADWYNDKEYGQRAGKRVMNPTGPSTGTHRVLRGGSWYNNEILARAAYRDRNHPGNRDDDVGFRVVTVPVP